MNEIRTRDSLPTEEASLPEGHRGESMTGEMHPQSDEWVTPIATRISRV